MWHYNIALQLVVEPYIPARAWVMSHISEHLSESCHIYKWSCVWTSHVHEWCHICQCISVGTITYISHSASYERVMSHELCHIWKSHVTWVMSHMKESRHVSYGTHERVMSRELCHTWKSHVILLKESCHTYERVIHYTAPLDRAIHSCTPMSNVAYIGASEVVLSHI